MFKKLCIYKLAFLKIVLRILVFELGSKQYSVSISKSSHPKTQNSLILHFTPTEKSDLGKVKPGSALICVLGDWELQAKRGPLRGSGEGSRDSHFSIGASSYSRPKICNSSASCWVDTDMVTQEWRRVHTALT